MITITTIKRSVVLGLDGLVVLLCIFGKQMVAVVHATIPACPFYEKGILCPACGSTRAVGAFLRGDIAAAFGYHPYLICLAILCALGLVLANLAYVFKLFWAQRVGTVVFRGMTVIILAGGYAVFGIARMLLT